MFKPLTLGVSLAVALGASSVVLAGGHGKSLPTPQGPVPTEQVVPSAQCAPACGPVAKKCFTLPHISLPKITFNHNYSYEWVLKKKHCGPWFTVTKGGHGHKAPAAGCDACAAPSVYPTSQYASPQAWGSGQAATYGSGQIYSAAPVGGEMAPPPPAGEEAPIGEVPPPPPAGNPGASLLFLPSPTGGN